MKMGSGNLAVLALALSISSYYCFAFSNHESIIVAWTLAGIVWLVVFDTFRPLYSVKVPKDYDHAKSRVPGEQLPPPYPGESKNVSSDFKTS